MVKGRKKKKMAMERVKDSVKGKKKFGRRGRECAPLGCIATKRRERVWLERKREIW